MDRFAQILFDLSKEIGIDLYPDDNRICQINYHDEIHLQIAYEEAKERVLISSFIAEVPPGKYREKLLKAALKNNNEVPRAGIFGYSERNNQLTLFIYQPALQLTGEKLYQALNNFIDLGLLWKDAVENGKPLPTQSDNSGGDAMFGLKP